MHWRCLLLYAYVCWYSVFTGYLSFITSNSSPQRPTIRGILWLNWSLDAVMLLAGGECQVAHRWIHAHCRTNLLHILLNFNENFTLRWISGSPGRLMNPLMFILWKHVRDCAKGGKEYFCYAEHLFLHIRQNAERCNNCASAIFKPWITATDESTFSRWTISHVKPTYQLASPHSRENVQISKSIRPLWFWP